MKTTQKHNDRVANFTFASIYPHYITKVEKKGLESKVLQEYDNIELSHILFQMIRNLYENYSSIGIKNLFGGNIGSTVAAILNNESQYSPEEFKEILSNTMRKKIIESGYHTDSTYVHNEMIS